MIRLFTTGAFWGILLLLIGLDILLKSLFKVDIQLFGLLFAALFIYIGAMIITGGFGKKTLYGYNTIKHDISSQQDEYNLAFGATVLDFYDVPAEKDLKLKVNTMFGACILLINPKSPVRVRIETSFGGVKLPDGKSVAFGTFNYKTDSYDKDKSYLYLKVNCLFGGMKIVTDKEEASCEKWDWHEKDYKGWRNRE